VVAMSNDVTIPENLGLPAAAFREQNVRTESLGEGIDGFGFNLVTARGNRLYLRYDGEEHTLLNPETKKPADYFDFVILQKGSRKSLIAMPRSCPTAAEHPSRLSCG
jgi:hypothetical protein